MSVNEDQPNFGNMKSCAFCGQKRKLTKEHIWPKWLSAYLPYSEQRTPHYVMNTMGEMKTGKLHRPGDLHAQTLKIVCKECNSGWMSWLQNVAKNQLVPLLHDEWRPLNDNSINVIKAWIVMYTMVSEFSDLDTATIPEHQRTHLMASVVSAQRGGVEMLKNAVPNGWTMWLGRSDPEGDHPGRMNHFGGRLPGFNRHGVLVPLPFQITGFTVGKLLVLAVMFTPGSPIALDYLKIEQENDLHMIHPVVRSDITKPQTAAGLNKFYNLTNGFAGDLGMERCISYEKRS